MGLFQGASEVRVKPKQKGQPREGEKEMPKKDGLMVLSK